MRGGPLSCATGELPTKTESPATSMRDTKSLLSMTVLDVLTAALPLGWPGSCGMARASPEFPRAVEIQNSLATRSPCPAEILRPFPAWRVISPANRSNPSQKSSPPCERKVQAPGDSASPVDNPFHRPAAPNKDSSNPTSQPAIG